MGVNGCGQVAPFHMQDATSIAFGGHEPICCIIKPIKERLPALLLYMQSLKEIIEKAYVKLPYKSDSFYPYYLLGTK